MLVPPARSPYESQRRKAPTKSSRSPTISTSAGRPASHPRLLSSAGALFDARNPSSGRLSNGPPDPSPRASFSGLKLIRRLSGPGYIRQRHRNLDEHFAHLTHPALFGGGDALLRG